MASDPRAHRGVSRSRRHSSGRSNLFLRCARDRAVREAHRPGNRAGRRAHRCNDRRPSQRHLRQSAGIDHYHGCPSSGPAGDGARLDRWCVACQSSDGSRFLLSTRRPAPPQPGLQPERGTGLLVHHGAGLDQLGAPERVPSRPGLGTLPWRARYLGPDRGSRPAGSLRAFPALFSKLEFGHFRRGSMRPR